MGKVHAQKLLQKLEANFLKPNLPTLKVGNAIKVGVKIVEGNKERIQFYEGTIIAKHQRSLNTSITVRKVFQGVGIERTFLIHSPKVESLRVLRASKVRRAKLYYLRGLTGKASRLKQIFS